MKFRFTIAIAATLMAAGCQDRKPEDVLFPELKGSWLPDFGRNATCERAGLRFGQAAIHVRSGGFEVRAFDIEKVDRRGPDIELRLRIAEGAAGLAFRRSEKDREKARTTTVDVSLKVLGDKIQLVNADIREEGVGLRLPRRGEARALRQMFTLSRCAEA